MAISSQDFNETVGLPGLIFPFVPHSIETGLLMDSKEAGGGFPLFSVVGQPDKVWAEKPQSSEAVARVVEVDVGGTVAEGDKFSVSINDTKYEVTAESGDDAADVAGDLATAISADDNYGATSSSGKVTITAKTAGAAANADVFTVAKTSTAGTIAKTEKTEGADATLGGTFVGIAARTRQDCHDEGYAAGDHINVLKKGRTWVRVLGEVLAGQAAYVNDTNFAITATSDGATAIAGGVFKTNAADGELAQLEIA